MKHITSSKWLALAAILAFSGTKGEAQILLNGSFETESTSPGSDFVVEDPTDWETGVSNPYVIESGAPDFGGFAAEDGSIYIGMQGSPSDSPFIYQDVTGLIVGDTYEVTLYTSVRAGGSAGTFTIDDNAAEAGTLATDSTPIADSWTEVTYTFTADATNGNFNIIWTPASDGDIGFIDNVSIADAPEPGSIALCSAGLVGLVFVARFRRMHAGA
jgi:hypothetical protein